MKIRLISVISGMVLFASLAFAQGACYPAGVVLLDTGRPANGASVRVCTSGSTGTPCTPAASLFTDPTLGTPLGGSPTVTTDAHGNFGFCAAAGANYDLQITGTGITPLTIKNLPLPPTSPITAASLTSSSANPANVGQIKLASGDCLDWRNNANTGNIQLCKDTSDALDLTAFSAVKTTAVSATQTGGGPSAGMSEKSASPFFAWQATGQAADQKWWDCGASGLTFVCRAVNDANNNAGVWVTVNRGAGVAISSIAFGSGGGSQTVPSSTGNFVLDTAAQTLTSKTLTSPAINTPSFSAMCNNNSTGCKAQRFGATTATGTTAGAQQTTAYTWASPFANANYTLSVTCRGATNTVPSLAIQSITASGFVVIVQANVPAAAGTTCTNIDAIAILD